MLRSVLGAIKSSVCLICISFGLLSIAPNVLASPWIEVEDPFLRASIQQLADGGHLRGNVSTYPLMWYSVARDMREINVSALSEREQFAYYRVRAALQFAQQTHVQSVQLRAASDEYSVQGFAPRHRERGALRASRTFTRDFVSARFQTTLKTDSVDGKAYAFDGSYLATTLGNWAISLDQMDVWWGPGHDNALVMSSYAAPIQAVRVNRLNTETAAWLPLPGQWHATAFIGRTQRAGALSDHPVFGARASWRPFSQLEIGASYTGQWGGDGYSGDIDYALDVLTLQENDEVGNQRAGVDARFVLHPRVGLYAEMATNNDSFDDPAYTFGADMRIPATERLREVFVEYTDIPAYFYDDERDLAGYRRYGMSMGAAQDQDVEALVVGFRQQRSDGTGFTLRFRDSDYGATNWQIARDYALNAGDRVKRRQLDLEYQQPVGDSLVRVRIDYYNDRFSMADLNPSIGNSSSKSSVNVSASWELRF